MKIFKKDGTPDRLNEKGWNGFSGLHTGHDIQAGILISVIRMAFVRHGTSKPNFYNKDWISNVELDIAAVFCCCLPAHGWSVDLRKTIMKNKNTLWFYLIIVFISNCTWQLAIFFTGGIDSKLFPFVMWFPGIVAIVFRLITKEGFRNVGWGLGKWGYILPAILLPAMVTVTCIFLLSTLKWAAWSDLFFVFHDGMVDIPEVPMILGNHTQGIVFFALNFGLSLGFQTVIGSLFTFGEEFGWQGYLMQKLLGKYGLNRGLVILGVVWGYWHLPIILMGYNFPNHPVLGALLLMPLSTIFIGIFQAWLYLSSKSIWMPMLAHAAANLTAPILFSGMVMNQDELARQLTWIGIWGVLSMLCLMSLDRNRPSLWQEKV